MIVKVQVSLATTEPKRRVLVYNRSRSVQWEDEASADILKVMNGKAKAFFHATVSKKTKRLEIGAETDWQDW
jgi:hypothetical protein